MNMMITVAATADTTSHLRSMLIGVNGVQLWDATEWLYPGLDASFSLPGGVPLAAVPVVFDDRARDEVIDRLHRLQQAESAQELLLLDPVSGLQIARIPKGATAPEVARLLERASLLEDNRTIVQTEKSFTVIAVKSIVRDIHRRLTALEGVEPSEIDDWEGAGSSLDAPFNPWPANEALAAVTAVFHPGARFSVIRQLLIAQSESPARYELLILDPTTGSEIGRVDGSAKVQDVTLLIERSPDVFLGIGGSEDRIAPPLDRITSPRDRVASPRDRVASPRDRITSPRHRITSPRDRTASPSEPSEETRSSYERRINIWAGDDPLNTWSPLDIGIASPIHFMVGGFVSASVAVGAQSVIPDSDVPTTGLDTRWVISSTDLALASVSPDTSVEVGENDGKAEWSATFTLHIPAQGNSYEAVLLATALTREVGRLNVLMYTGAELYRQLTVAFAVRSAQPLPASRATVTVEGDHPRSPAGHQCLEPPHEWTTPPGHLSITIVSKMAILMGDTMGSDTAGNRIASNETGGREPWVGVANRVSGQIKNVLADAERFRAKHDSYLNNIPPDDLIARLSSPYHQYDWTNFQIRADQTHEQAWTQVAASQELWDMASDGRMLYDQFFPPKSRLRMIFDFLTPGHRIDIDWTPLEDSYIAHVPWGLMYVDDVPPKGQPVDPTGFFGLRFRVGYTSHLMLGGTGKGLGKLDNTYGARLMYEGDQPGAAPDPIAWESSWQRTLWTSLANQIMAPSGAGDPLAELRRLLADPGPAPISVLYIYCQSGGPVTDPILRFGPPNHPFDLTRSDMGFNQIPGQPLVFANACSTTTADPYLASMLEEAFFNRGCRGYVGTETKVPITLASRFASIFFRYFYRQIVPEPISAGESLAQARLFLWTNYRNIGGLFYSFVNNYELFMADDDELKAMRR